MENNLAGKEVEKVANNEKFINHSAGSRKYRNQTDEEKQFIEKVVGIKRVNKVVKGGKRLAFQAFVIVGDKKGKVSLAIGKSKEVPMAIKKAIETAKKRLTNVQVINGTIAHDVIGTFGSVKVKIRPAKPGTGVIAGGSVRIYLEAAGYTDVVAKIMKGSGNALNSAKAAALAISSLQTMDDLMKRKGSKITTSNKKEI